jgi:tetratricopeptide (TPR) repeat protein
MLKAQAAASACLGVRWKSVMRSAAFTFVVMLTATAAAANPASEALRTRAAAEFYNLNIDQALALYREAIGADPDDPRAHRGLASAIWTSITFSRGQLTVDNYLGGISRQNVKIAPPPPELASTFRKAINRAIELSRTQVKADPKSTGAQFDLGSAIGLNASYIATVEGGMMGAFRAAREAFDAHEKVLSLDPSRRDAALIVGTYRYIVSALSMPLRWAAYVVGFGGGKEQGLKLIEDAAAYGGGNHADARLALVLIYNREKRYDDALKHLAVLREQFAQNRLLWLEAGATALRAGRAAEAEQLLTEGLARFADDTRPRMFSEESMWFYKRGTARAVLGQTADAEQDLRKAVSTEGRRWVRGRAHFELGKLALKSGDRTRANTELRAALELCQSDGDNAVAAEARRLVK